MTLGESKDELRWALCDDSVVVDLMRIAPRVVLDAIRVAGERPVRPYWRSSTDSHGASQWHYNHSARMPETGKVLPAGPVGGRPRRSIGLVLKSSSYTDWKALWETVRDALSVPDGCELLRIYQNVYPYGADGCAHVDSDEPDEVTACIYVHPHWHKDWGGETVVFDPNDEVRRAVLPAPGRLFAFRSMVPHAARPAARAAVPPRCVVVVKMGPWPIARRLANGGAGRDCEARGAQPWRGGGRPGAGLEPSEGAGESRPRHAVAAGNQSTAPAARIENPRGAPGRDRGLADGVGGENGDRAGRSRPCPVRDAILPRAVLRPGARPADAGDGVHRKGHGARARLRELRPGGAGRGRSEAPRTARHPWSSPGTRPDRKAQRRWDRYPSTPRCSRACT